MTDTTTTSMREELEDITDSISIAMGKAFQLGQTYWQQADSESYSKNKKSDVTQAKFNCLVDETKEKATANMQSKVSELEAKIAELQKDADRYRWLRENNSTMSCRPFIAIYTGTFSHFTGEVADKEVDAAIAEEGVK